MMNDVPVIATPVPRLAYSIPEAAQAVGLSPRFVWTLIDRGTLKALRVGKRVLVPVEELQRFARISTAEVSGVQ